MTTVSEATTQQSTIEEISGPEPFGLNTDDLRFVTEKGSPWPDGYSIEGERKALADLMDRDDAEADPRWPRVVELERREASFQQAMATYKQRRGADLVVNDGEAGALRRLGSLVDAERDTMVLHTAEAHRLFVGRAASPDKLLYAIPGGKRQGSALRFLWLLTGNDNPYADWALLRHEMHHRQLVKAMSEAIERCEKKIQQLNNKGLRIGIMSSAEPQEMELGFKSPYAYAVCELIVDYDRFVRHVTTLKNKNQFSDEEARKEIREITRQIRRNWIETMSFERFLTRSEVRDLSRSDFLPSASEDGRRRAQAVSERFRGIPTKIFEGSLVPSHSRRRQAGSMSSEERRLLHETAKQIEALDAEAIARSKEEELSEI